MQNYTIHWHELNDQAIIPTKRAEDAGFDLYTTESDILLMPGEIHMFPTGLQSAFSPELVGIIKERGSTGANGLAVRSGIMDSGFRGEWKVIIQNLNSFPVKFTSDMLKITKADNDFYFDPDGRECCGEILYYPIYKAIAQVIFFNIPSITTITSTANLSEVAPSDRQSGGWGSSNK